MKINRLFLPVVLLSAILSACSSSEEIAYIHDATRDSAMALSGQFSKGIQANDILYIYVESETPESTIPFNQETNKVAVKDGSVLNATSGATKVQ